MPKRTDITSILIIGAGPIVIGQACEFDYSGTQAVKTLKDEGYRIVLVNSNPATIMTDPELADASYIEPISPEIVAKIIERERNVVPGGFALLPTMGGQTALNCALSLRKQGTLQKFDVEMIGATADAIDKAEDRGRFREAMTRIGLETPRSTQTKNLPDASLAVLREIGVETGGSNVQFGVNPADGRMVVIEMNPRVSRSSALASKATGFPIAKVAAKLAVGFTLDEIANDITGGATPASFEPTIDYVVTKVPRFAFEKFPGASHTLTTSMKSVGEVMAIGRTFQESLQKALRGLETGLTGLDEIEIEGLGRGDDKNAIRAALGTPTPNRILQVAQAMRLGWTDDDIFNSCKIDPWFLSEMRGIVEMEAKIKANGLPANAFGMRTLKAMGFSDARLAVLSESTEADITARRHALAVRPVFKRIDTCAAEFASPTAYMYSTYESPFAGAPSDESAPSDKTKVIILGGGPNRIGQGIEFDYCCCHACFALHDAGYETIMINCNPETVSTDYDTADRLYFEPLTTEDVLEIIATERQNGTLHGVIVQFGGQTPLKLARALEAADVPILGTSPDAIDLAEDRDRFKRVLDKLRLKQPKNGIAYSVEQARLVAADLGLPLVVRPSYVLGGRAMQIIREENQLNDYLLGTLPELVPGDVKARYPNDKTGQINTVLGKNPLLFDRYLSDATEIDVDCLCDGKDTFIVGIMEHTGEAGSRSGASACSLPPHSLDAVMITELERQTRELALGLDVVGLMNVQYAIKDGEIHVLEVNPRASRTVPFVAKVIGMPVAKIAARLMAGVKLADFNMKKRKLGHDGVKESVFPFARFRGVDTVLGPEMRSTGEVMGIDRSFEVAFAKSQLGGGTRVPRKGTVFVSVRESDKTRIAEAVQLLHSLGFNVMATSGTQRFLTDAGVPTEKVNKVLEGRPHIVDAIMNGDIQLVFNTTEGPQALADSRSLRRAALLHKVPYYTTLSGAVAAAQGIRAYLGGDLEVRTLQSYFSET